MFRQLDEAEADQVVAWRPPALAVPHGPDAAVLAALEAAGIPGGFRIDDRRAKGEVAAPVTVHSTEQLASMVADELDAEQAADSSGAALAPDAAGGTATDGCKTSADGFDDAFEAGAASVREALAAEHRVALERFAAEHERWRGERDAEIVSLATALASAVLRRKLVDDPMALQLLVRDTLAPFESGQVRATVQLHPSDLAALERAGGMPGTVDMQADTTLARGDCRIRSGASLIDAGIADRLSALLADEAS